MRTSECISSIWPFSSREAGTSSSSVPPWHETAVSAPLEPTLLAVDRCSRLGGVELLSDRALDLAPRRPRKEKETRPSPPPLPVVRAETVPPRVAALLGRMGNEVAGGRPAPSKPRSGVRRELLNFRTGLGDGVPSPPPLTGHCVRGWDGALSQSWEYTPYILGTP